MGGKLRTVDQPAPYSERLSVPLRWWVQGTMLVVMFWLALVVAIPWTPAWAIAVLALAAMAGVLVAYGWARVEVGGGWLRAGRARIETRYVGACTPLDAEETRRTAGRDADARAYLLLRPYLPRAVRVEITDPADPVPYWLVCTRNPDRLAKALAALDR